MPLVKGSMEVQKGHQCVCFGGGGLDGSEQLS
jgi:hypothetical protein